MGAKQETLCGFAPLRLCVENFPTEYAAPTGLGSSPSGWERMPKAGEGFSFFGFGSTNMPRRRRWGRTPCQYHFALDVWGERGRPACGFGRRARNLVGQISWLKGFRRDAENGNRDGRAPRRKATP